MATMGAAQAQLPATSKCLGALTNAGHLPIRNARNAGHLPILRNARKVSGVRACVPEGGVAEAGDESKSTKKLSQQSSWEAKDVLGDDYLYRLGKEADNMNITVGAKSGMIDDLFTGNFLGKEGTSGSEEKNANPSLQ